MLSALIMETMFDTDEMKQEKTVRPRSMPPMENTRSRSDTGTISPKPVVLIVANVQYIAETYLQHGILWSFCPFCTPRLLLQKI